MDANQFVLACTVDLKVQLNKLVESVYVKAPEHVELGVCTGGSLVGSVEEKDLSPWY